MAEKPDLDRAYALKTTADNRAFYRDWAEDYDTVFVGDTSYQLPDLIAQTYVQLGGQWPVLDAGCGTGALGERMPVEAVVDGIDLSSEMIEVARGKGRYRSLVEADLKDVIPFEDGTFAGIISSGTFTHGHVGPEALGELIRVMKGGGLAVLSVKPEIWEAYGFEAEFLRFAKAGMITSAVIEDVPVYANPASAPEGHADDRGLIVKFRRLG